MCNQTKKKKEEEEKKKKTWYVPIFMIMHNKKLLDINLAYFILKRELLF